MGRKKYQELSRWVEKAQEEDEEAFRYLYDYTHKNITYLVYNFCVNKEEVEDIVQEVYLNIFSSLQQLKDPQTFIKWSNQIAYRCCIRSLRQSRDEVFLGDNEEWGYEAWVDKEENPLLSEILREEKSRLLIECMNKLPERQKITLFMRVYSELKYKEIAQILEISEDSVKKNLRIGRKNLKKIIEGLPKEDRSILTVRGFSGFTLYQILKQIFQEYQRNEEGILGVFGYKIAVGAAAIILLGGGAVYYINKTPGENVNESKVVIEKETNNDSIDDQETDEAEWEEQVTEVPLVETEEEIKKQPRLVSWQVVGDYLCIYVKDEVGIDYENTFGLTFGGKAVNPIRYDEEEGIFYFDAYEQSFFLFLHNTIGEVKIWNMIREE